MDEPTALIGLDWGTTSARAYRIAHDGRVLETRTAPLGIQQVTDGAFAEALATLLGDWRGLRVPRLACGMVGSRQGWIEAPYRTCPVALSSLAEGLIRTPGGELAIVSGITCRDEGGVPDVIRGEETQVLGLIDAAETGALVVQPGTHSKWTIVSEYQGVAAITAFATYMTGEVFSVLHAHSILGRSMTPTEQFDHDHFDRGVERGAGGAAPGELLHQIFGARTLALFDEVAPAGAADYLSGILIGAEIAAGRQWAMRRNAMPASLWLAGTPELCERYGRAIRHCGLQARQAPPDVAARGLWRIASRAGVVQQGT